MIIILWVFLCTNKVIDSKNLLFADLFFKIDGPHLFLFENYSLKQINLTAIKKFTSMD